MENAWPFVYMPLELLNAGLPRFAECWRRIRIKDFPQAKWILQLTWADAKFYPKLRVEFDLTLCRVHMPNLHSDSGKRWIGISSRFNVNSTQGVRVLNQIWHEVSGNNFRLFACVQSRIAISHPESRDFTESPYDSSGKMIIIAKEPHGIRSEISRKFDDKIPAIWSRPASIFKR